VAKARTVAWRAEMPQAKRETEISADHRPTFGYLENHKQFQLCMSSQLF
jgi:hypothetical protein